MKPRRLSNIVLLAILFASAAAFSPATAADARRYCFSDICIGDPPSVLAPLTLSDLNKMAVRSRGTGTLATLEAAAPGLGRVARATFLASYTDASGSLLLDRRTLPIVLGIERICAPVGPFVSMFASESGHPTAVEFQAIAGEGGVRLGVTRVARSFQVKPGSSEERALLADLSEKFGFRVDDGAEQSLPAGGPREVTAAFTRQADGIRVSFARDPIAASAAEFRAQADCGPTTRIKID